VYETGLPPASTPVSAFTWQPAQSRGFAEDPCVVRMALLSYMVPGGKYPAVPNNTGPCAACGPRELVAEASDLRLWQRVHRFTSMAGEVIGKRSIPGQGRFVAGSLAVPCGSWQTAQVCGSRISVPNSL
jgi:hypothetical protein